MLRQRILDMAYRGGTVHVACAFSLVEILAVLYRDHLNFPGNDPDARDRDFLILSKGHGVMAQYACMRELGWLDDEDLENYFADGTVLKGLSDSRVRGLEVSSGSLGHGFSVGVGIAFALKRQGSAQSVYTVVGDGEINEGPIWEGALFAAHHQLTNFLVIVDLNGFQAMGRTNEILDLGSVHTKFEAFGFDVRTVDGHNEVAISNAILTLRSSEDLKPKALIAHTTKGRGVSFMEDDNRWHYSRLDSNTYNRASQELRSAEP